MSAFVGTSYQIVAVLLVLLVCVADATTINFIYLHGVQGCPADRLAAHNKLTDLKNSLTTALAGSPYTYTHTLANLYTEAPSSCAPSDSKGPTYMDDWEAGDGCGSTASGDPGTTAYEWRYRLANIVKRFSGNVVLIGHSTGARTAVEVTANVGGSSGTVGSYNWGVQSKILGVATVAGMISDLNTKNYNVIGPTSFQIACKRGDFLFVGPSCSNGNGWCEYAALNSGVAANDWVAKNKFVLNLVSYSSCSPNIWKGWSDGMLPYDAQSSPAAPGLDMTTVTGDVFTATNGIKYGSFCHSTITSSSDANHAACVTAATAQIKSWLLTSALRVARSGSTTTASSISYMASTPVYIIAAGCPTGFVDGSVAVAGVCRHPGFFDGDDHPIDKAELMVTDGSTCDGSYKWTQTHDSGNAHAANLYYKSHAKWVGGVASKATASKKK